MFSKILTVCTTDLVAFNSISVSAHFGLMHVSFLQMPFLKMDAIKEKTLIFCDNNGKVSDNKIDFFDNV